MLAYIMLIKILYKSTCYYRTFINIEQACLHQIGELGDKIKLEINYKNNKTMQSISIESNYFI